MPFTVNTSHDNSIHPISQRINQPNERYSGSAGVEYNNVAPWGYAVSNSSSQPYVPNHGYFRPELLPLHTSGEFKSDLNPHSIQDHDYTINDNSLVPLAPPHLAEQPGRVEKQAPSPLLSKEQETTRKGNKYRASVVDLCLQNSMIPS
jgi:hypothetical protein